MIDLKLGKTSIIINLINYVLCGIYLVLTYAIDESMHVVHLVHRWKRVEVLIVRSLVLQTQVIRERDEGGWTRSNTHTNNNIRPVMRRSMWRRITWTTNPQMRVYKSIYRREARATLLVPILSYMGLGQSLWAFYIS